MAEIRLVIPDAALPRVVDALCAYGGRPDDSTVTAPAFAKRVIAAWVTGIVRAHEAQQAAEMARSSASARVDAEVTIT